MTTSYHAASEDDLCYPVGWLDHPRQLYPRAVSAVYRGAYSAPGASEGG